MDSDLNLPSQSSTNEGFVYDIKVETDSELFKHGPLSELFTHFGEMVIESEWFHRHQDCQDDALSMLTEMANIMRLETGRMYAIATKVNPCHDEGYIAEEDTDPWDPTIVMRLYLCDHQKLTTEMIVDAQITATIWCSPHINFGSQPPTITRQ